MKRGFFLTTLALALLLSCRQSESISFSEAQRIDIDETISDVQAVNELIAPYKNQIEHSLSTVLSYAPETYSKKDEELNTALGNMMADAVYAQSNPIFKKRTGQTLDFVLLNYGGIRSSIQEGSIDIKDIYELMPFDNEIIIVALKGKQIHTLLSYLQKSRRAHPISKELKIVLSKDHQLISTSINNQSINPERIYYVGTSDYLFNGGDHMTFFMNNEGHYKMDYKVRNALIDFIEKTDTLQLAVDERFVIKRQP